MSAINVNSITGRTGTHGPVLTGVTTATNGLNITSGFVGIGTDSPGVQLEVKGTASTLLRLDSSSSSGTSLRILNGGTDKMYMGLAGDFITGQGSNVTDSAVRANGALLFSTGGGSEKLRITSAGNVGIGTNAPLQTSSGRTVLNINGTNNALLNFSYGATLSGFLYGANDEFRMEADGTNPLVFRTAGGTALTIDTNAKLILPTGSPGIQFGSTDSGGSVTSQTLDDYEEGAHVPALAATTGTLGSITYSTDTGGKYIKIGSIVHFWGTVRWSAYNVGSGSGSIQVTMPFTNVARTSGDDADNAGAAFTPVWGGTSNKVPTTVFGIQNQSKLGFRAGSNDSIAGSVQVSQVGPTGMVNFSITYQTSS